MNYEKKLYVQFPNDWSYEIINCKPIKVKWESILAYECFFFTFTDEVSSSIQVSSFYTIKRANCIISRACQTTFPSISSNIILWSISQQISISVH